MAEPALLPEPSLAPAPASLELAPPPRERRRSRLELPRYDFVAALALERELGIGHVLAQILVRRGLSDAEAARSFLEADQGHPPSDFAGLAAAVQTIESHLAAGSPITVHGDYDVDGVCATAIMVAALRSLGGRVDWYLPGRIEDGYGLNPATVARLAGRGTRLLITVDCAITAVDEVAVAQSAGMDVVVCDHHHARPDGRLPDCPIVHPAICGYPCPELCGTGVAYKLAEALGASVEEELELVALATVADLMPLRGENRRLVREGLARMANTARPGLQALMAVARVDPSALDARDLGFRLGPRINACGRISRADAALELLLTGDPARAREIAGELDRLNAERRAIEERVTWEAEAQVAAAGDRPAYVLAGENWHPGVVGIVASRIVERHHRPAVLVALDGSTGTGSARSIPGFDLLGGLHACSEHLDRYGGHRAAAGLALSRDRVDALRQSFEAHAAAVLTPELLEGVERVDAVVCGSELGLGLIEELELLEPTGQGNPRPRLLVAGARLGEVRAMGQGRHARFKLIAGGARTPAVAFGCDGELRDQAGLPLDVSFRLERNCWNGVVEPRLVLRETWPCAPAPIEVLGEDQYLAAALGEVDRPLDAPLPGGPGSGSRTVVDRRHHGPLSTLTDALAASPSVLAVCSDVPRRLEGLQRRVGGFSLVSYHSLELDPGLGAGFEHLVALDPPTCPPHEQLLSWGIGFTQLAWGEAELRFAQQMHELEYGLRTSLVTLYRALRARQRVAGEELERLLRGDGSPGRPARLAGRLIRILAELELVSLDRDLRALALAGGAPTSLDRSPAYRVYAQRHEDGRRFLSSANLNPPRD
ncbi:MAG TPA: single-stranded-DNA-specific exonuclease RecJ [Solirubrobacteraceae bacterium]|nr:single-stranded-DNA-specific exonuclease RecJ [Solirubrobacteraceae bacterium]